MLRVDYPFKNQILACGAQTQASFCLTKTNCAYVINDLGSLEQASVLENYQLQIERSKRELKVKPKVIAYDLHPQYASTRYALKLSQQSSGLKLVPIQHHQAHIASCIGENALCERIIGVVLDSAGLGDDGQLWGGEFFVGDIKGLKRTAHLKYTPIPDAKEENFLPWMQAASYLYQAFGEDFDDLEIDFVRCRQKEDWQMFKQKLASNLYSSSMACLFDVVSALVGLSEKGKYQDQGITALERIINRSTHVAGKTYEFKVVKDKDEFLICPEAIIQNIVQDLEKNISKSIISATFHNTIIEIVRTICGKIKGKEKLKDVVLTGSCFKNKFLFNQLKDRLAGDGFKVITHKHLSCNDSGIAFGQAVLAEAQC